MIAVTGAGGHYGGLVVAGLLAAGVPAREIVAVVRSPDKVGGLAEHGVRIRPADYADPVALGAELHGVDRLLLVSGTEVGERVTQHGNVVRAAADNGVGLLLYTSAPKAADTPLPIAPEHAATEELIAESRIPAVLLRNNWYFENYDGPISQAAATGEIVGSSGGGRIGAATRADLAAAAVAVLTADAPEPATYELGGDEAWNLAELAAAVSLESGREVVYRDLTSEEHLDHLVSVGLPESVAGFVVALDAAIAAGALDTGSRALSELIGRPTTTLQSYVGQVVAHL